jgi:hypothetical protein
MVKHQISNLCTKRSQQVTDIIIQQVTDSIICLDDDIKVNINNDKTVNTLQDTTSVAEVKIESVDVASAITIIISSDEESIKSGNEVKNQQPLQRSLKLNKKRKTLVKNKKFKCVQCFLLT